METFCCSQPSDALAINLATDFCMLHWQLWVSQHQQSPFSLPLQKLIWKFYWSMTSSMAIFLSKPMVDFLPYEFHQAIFIWTFVKANFCSVKGRYPNGKICSSKHMAKNDSTATVKSQVDRRTIQFWGFNNWDELVKFVSYDLTTFVLKNLRRLFDKYAVARTEHNALVKSTTNIFSNFVAF